MYPLPAAKKASPEVVRMACCGVRGWWSEKRPEVLTRQENYIEVSAAMAV